jgi:DNA-binding Lrp family transcriptional regulator
LTAPSTLRLDDPTTKAILRVSEDGLRGFCEQPFAEIARLTGLSESIVLERIRELLEAGVVRRVRLTLNTANLADGALVAWKIPTESLQSGFDTLFQDDPFSGHVVIRSTDGAMPGSGYRLWTTLKVPQGYSLQKHAEEMARRIGAESYRLMPAKCLFALGVGHVRRREIEPGARGASADTRFPTLTRLTPNEWRTLALLKEPLACDEVVERPWEARAERSGL